MVIGGHGDGFRRRGRSLAVDEFGSALDMTEIEYVLTKRGFHKNRIGILGFDACLMGMLEIAHHFSPFANYLVGSQQVEPGDGWPYDRVLKLLKTKHELGKVGIGIVDAYTDHYIQMGIADTTQSVINLQKTDSAMMALSDLGNALNTFARDDNRSDAIQKIDRVRARTQSFCDGEYVDVIHLAELIDCENYSDDVNKACKNLAAQIKHIVLFNRVPNQKRSRKLRNANGLSIWFPATTFSYAVNRAKYFEMKGVEEYPNWLEFLDLFFATLRHK